jgi:DNA-directed RNA polymerase specialized sigma24 family protein
MDIKKRIQEEPDFIDSPRHDNSLSKLLTKKVDGVDEKTIAKLLHMSEEEVHDTIVRVVDKIRKAMKVE